MDIANKFMVSKRGEHTMIMVLNNHHGYWDDGCSELHKPGCIMEVKSS